MADGEWEADAPGLGDRLRDLGPAGLDKVGKLLILIGEEYVQAGFALGETVPDERPDEFWECWARLRPVRSALSRLLGEIDAIILIGGCLWRRRGPSAG